MTDESIAAIETMQRLNLLTANLNTYQLILLWKYWNIYSVYSSNSPASLSRSMNWSDFALGEFSMTSVLPFVQ